jgi:hypothetical protein
MEHNFECRRRGEKMNEVLLIACKELIDDAKNGCADLVFKDICLEILARAKQVLTDAQFKELSYYAAEKIKEKSSLREAELPI